MSGLGLTLAVSAAGGAGAALRYLVDAGVRSLRPIPTRGGRLWPLGILLVNLSGSFALGVLTGYTLLRDPGELALVAGTGFLGGYTTFSTASVDAVLLAREGSRTSALGYLAASVGGCVALAGLGLTLGLRLG